MTFYRVAQFESEIEPVEAERETSDCIWIQGRRSAKQSEWQIYAKTPEEARAWLVAYWDKKCKQASQQVMFFVEKMEKANMIEVRKQASK